MNRNLSGLYSGLIATGPMTLFMMGIQEELPASERSPLPPATLSFQIVKRVFKPQKISSNQQTLLTMASHFGYGTGAGILYSHTLARLPGTGKGIGAAKGAAFGVVFWAANYFGLSRSLRLRANAPNMPFRRNAMMLAAHVIWGASLGYAEEILRASGKQMLAGSRRAIAAE